MFYGEVAVRSRRSEDAALAYDRRGSILARRGDSAGAVAAWRRAVATGDSERAALAAFRLAERDAAVSDALGQQALLEVATRYPDRAAAKRAIAALPSTLDDATPVEARRIAEALEALARAHPETEAAGNAMWTRAEIELFVLGDLAAARRALRLLYTLAPMGPLADDALWRLGALLRRQGAWRRAVATYEVLAGLRDEESWIVGSYRRAKQDDALQMVGDLELHARGRLAAAARAYRRLLDTYPNSVSRDDAYWGLAACARARGDEAGMRDALRRLLDEAPDSRFGARARAALVAPLDSPKWPDFAPPRDLLRPTFGAGVR